MTVSSSTQQNNFGVFSTVAKGLPYLLVGGGIGAVVGLLFAPKPGASLRSDISDLTRKGYGETLDLANQLKDKSADVLQSVRQKTDGAIAFAAAKLPRVAQDGIDLADGQAINGEILEINNKPVAKTLGSGRRSSSIL